MKKNNIGKWSCFILVCAIALCTGLNSFSATITVTNTNDTGAGSFRQAMLDAGSTDTIDCTGISGTITLSSSLPTITQNQTISGPGSGSLTIDGQDTYSIFYVGGSVTVNINNLTIANGVGPIVGGYTSGGGVCNIGGSTTVDNCVIQSCAATSGGGVFNENGTLIITNCTIQSNSATSGSDMRGGGVYNYSTTGEISTLQISDSTISNNVSMYSGGGIYLLQSAGTASTTITTCSISSNSTTGTDSISCRGGGVYNQNGNLYITDTTISGNSTNSAVSGGGVNLAAGGTIAINSSTISGNTAKDGAGLELYDGASVTLNNCTISGNTAGSGRYGAGIDIAGGTVNLDSCTIASNAFTSGGYGGGVSLYDGTCTLNFKNTIIANNTGTNPDIDNPAGGTVNSQDYNLIENTTGANITGTTTNNITGTDPGLGALSDNGGPTQTHAISGPPCVDAGDTTLTTDQRGVSRSGTDDIGAYEYAAPENITIAAPNGGEYWLAGSIYTIAYSASSTISSVSIEYSLDSGASWEIVASSTPATGSHAWLIPDVSSTTCLMRVSDALQPSLEDVSDGEFQIENPLEPTPTPTQTPTPTATPTPTLTPTSTPTPCVTPACIGEISVGAIADATTPMGANALQQMFDTGDLSGDLTYISVEEFNGMTVSELREAFDALVFISHEVGDFNADWTTRLLPYMNLGGGVFWENVYNFGDLLPAVTKNYDPRVWGYQLDREVPILTQCLQASFKRSAFCFNTWDAPLNPYLTSYEESWYVMGINGEYPGGGRIVLTAAINNNYNGVRGSTDIHGYGNNYQQLLNGLLWVTENYRTAPVLSLQPANTTVHRGQDVEVAVNISDASGIVGYRVALDLDPSKVEYVDGSATKVGTSTEIGWGPLVVNCASPELAIFTCASATGTLPSASASLLKFQLHVNETLADFTPISVTFSPLTSLNEDALAYSAEIWSATVLGPNHIPTFTGGPSQVVLEDSEAHEISNWATDIFAGSIYESWQSMYFTLDVDTPQLFFGAPTLDATGTLRYTLASDEFGICNATAVLHDSGGTANGGVDSSTPYRFTFTVKPVNDAPSFIGGATVVVLNATGGQHTVDHWATAISAGPINESTQTLWFGVETERPEIFSVTPTIDASGTMRFTPNANAHGVVRATATLYDDGGIADGGINESSPTVFVMKIYIPFMWGDLNDNAQAGSVDASLLLQYAAELIDVFPGYPVAEYPEYYPDPSQPWLYFPLAADVNADGIAGTWDASYVLQKYAFLINWFPADVNHDQWGPDAPLPPGKAWKRSLPRTMNVSIQESDDAVFVTFQIDNAEDVQGLRTALFYDSAQLQFNGEESGWLVPSGLMVANDVEPGRVVLAGALGKPLSEGLCDLVTVKFNVVGGGSESLLIEVDEGQTCVNDGKIRIEFRY